MTASPSLPAGGAAGDVYIDAARELSRESVDPNQEALDADRESERVADGDPDVVLAPEAGRIQDDDAIDADDR